MGAFSGQYNGSNKIILGGSAGDNINNLICVGACGLGNTSSNNIVVVGAAGGPFITPQPPYSNTVCIGQKTGIVTNGGVSIGYYNYVNGTTLGSVIIGVVNSNNVVIGSHVDCFNNCNDNIVIGRGCNISSSFSNCIVMKRSHNDNDPKVVPTDNNQLIINLANNAARMMTTQFQLNATPPTGAISYVPISINDVLYYIRVQQL